jgi:rubrerythrin
MVQREAEYADRLISTAKKIKNPVINTILIGIAKDSEKHSHMYQAILNLTNYKGPMISEKIGEEIEREIENHINTEIEMIKSVEERLDEDDIDEPIKYLLTTILNDEIQHHKLLKNIFHIVIKREILSEEDLWENLWRDVPFHGTPGG